MREDVCPAPDAVLRSIFPGLKSVAVGEVVGWFPVVVGFVAVVNGRVDGGWEVGEEEHEED